MQRTIFKLTLCLCAFTIAFFVAHCSTTLHAQGSLTGRVIILDPGHGPGDSPMYAGYVEHIAMMQLANLIAPMLEARGAVVHLTRSGWYDVDFPTRIAQINLWSLQTLRTHTTDRELRAEIDEHIALMRRIIQNPILGNTYFNLPFDYSRTRRVHPTLERIFTLQRDPNVAHRYLMISLHSNSTGSPINHSVRGASAYYMSNTYHRSRNYFTGYQTYYSALFAYLIVAHIDQAGIRSRGSRPGNWAVIREHNLPGVLVENGYHTNPQDRVLLQDRAFMERLAGAYVNAIEQYFRYIGPPPVPNIPYMPIIPVEIERQPARLLVWDDASDGDTDHAYQNNVQPTHAIRSSRRPRVAGENP